jgi:hypothetical protein
MNATFFALNSTYVGQHRRWHVVINSVLTISVALLASACGSSAPKKTPDAPHEAARNDAQTSEIPEDLKEDVARSSQIGQAIFSLDTISAAGTDLLFKNVKDPGSKKLGGYITLPDMDDDGNFKKAYIVRFFTEDEPPRIAFEMRFTKESKPTFDAFDPPQAASPKFVDLVHARQVAINALPSSSQPINPVLIPGAARGEKGLLVYLLAGTAKPNVAVLGQHFVALVPFGAKSVSYMEPLSKSMIEIPTVTPDGEKASALVVTHMVTEYPLETHVFASMVADVPIVVVTNRGEWLVDGPKISFRSPTKKK